MANNTIYITGHRNPDTDSIVSAISYAYLKQQLGQDAIAVRIGELNNETKFVLDYFDEWAPPLVKDIRTRIRDIDFDSIVTCQRDTNLKDALTIMRQANKKYIIIVDKDGKMEGMATMSDITNPLIPDEDFNNKCIRETDFTDIVAFLQGNLVYKSTLQHTNGHVHMLASLKDNGCQDRIVLTGDDEQLQKYAIKQGAASLIGVDTTKLSDNVIALAKQFNCNLATCMGSMYKIGKKIYFASKIEKVMSTELTSFRSDGFVEDVKNAINKTRFRCYPILDANGKAIGTISRYHLFKHTVRNLILVDHNEASQSIDGIQQANIMEIIDHHRLGGLTTSSPIYIRNEQVGCSNTIISKMYQENNIAIPKQIAGIMASAIISDTVNFMSVTCTAEDKKQAAYLAKIAGINLQELGPKILASSVNIGLDSENVFHKDLKIFNVNSCKLAIGQTNIVSIDDILTSKKEYRETLEKYARDSGSNIVIMAFTKIDGSGSYLLMVGTLKNKLEEYFKQKGKEVNGFIFLENVISRKQQLMPLINEAIGG